MTDQEFIDGLTAQQATYFNARLVSIRNEFQASYAASVASVVTAKDALYSAKESELSTITTEKTQALTNLATRTTERDSLQSQVTTLTSEKESLTDQLNLANNTLTTIEALVATLQAKVVDLEQYRPFNPRIIDASKFYDRLTKDEILTLFSSSDATTKTIAETILAYKTNDWPVVFESPEFQQMLSYLMQSGTLTEARMAELTRDATRAEAYDAE